MEAKKIRSTFIEFFQSKQHQYVPSSPIVSQKRSHFWCLPNAGMNQFKDAFLGNEIAKFPKSSQQPKMPSSNAVSTMTWKRWVLTHIIIPCLRCWAIGLLVIISKRRPLLGLGSFWLRSMGFQRIDFMFLFFREINGDNLEMDKEAFWALECNCCLKTESSWVRRRINFWEMGIPVLVVLASEIHIDLRSTPSVQRFLGKTWSIMNHPQVIEIWNLVFMQFNRISDGSLKPLPAHSCGYRNGIWATG